MVGFSLTQKTVQQLEMSSSMQAQRHRAEHLIGGEDDLELQEEVPLEHLPESVLHDVVRISRWLVEYGRNQGEAARVWDLLWPMSLDLRKGDLLVSSLLRVSLMERFENFTRVIFR